MKLKVFPAERQGQDFYLINSKDDRLYIQTSEEYVAALSNGYFAFGSFNIRRSYIFGLQVAIINALSDIQPPDESYISKLGVGLTSLSLLPADILVSWGDAPSPSFGQGESVQDLVNNGRVIITEVSNYHVGLESEHDGWLLWEIMRGDLNADGLEEMFVYRYSYIKRATLRVGEPLLLSRIDDQSLFDVTALESHE